MCGFVGYIIENPAQEHGKIIRAMADTIAHRGPDQADHYVDGGCALGFRGLSFTDLEGEAQPVLNEDGSMVLVFDGKIYNCHVLREELLEKGHRFKTREDAEVLLHGYEEWGDGLLQKLRGVYAFVVWNQKENALFGARDMFGVKPFYYTLGEGPFLFGSEIKSFLPHPDFRKELNEERIPDYLCFEYLPMAETLFRGVYKLMPGHCFTYQNGQMEIRQHHTFEFKVNKKPSRKEWERMIAEEFTKSVEVHRAADTEVGCFLSGGVDSSYVVNEVAKVFKDVKTFSVGYTEEKYSELPRAQEFCQEIGVANISNKVSAEEFFGAASIIQYYMDEPLPNPSEIPLYFLAQNAAKHVKVVLSGEGADELFGGYPIYTEAIHFNRYRKLPQALRSGIASFASKRKRKFFGKRFLMRGALPPYVRYGRNEYVYTGVDRYAVLKDKQVVKDPWVYTRPLFEQMAGYDEPTQLQYADIHTWLAFDMLQKADRMTMAHSLEVRTPFLDREMLKIALQLPRKYRMAGKETKIALRGAALKELPEKTARRAKLGFPVPLDDWLRQDKFYEMVKACFSTEVAARFFDQAAILDLLERHKQGQHWMKKIWTVYSFLLWYDEFFVKR